MIVSSRAPVRVDFAGGWTDVDIFARGAGGIVINAAINHYVTGELEVLESEGDHGNERFGLALAGGKEGLRVTYQSDLPSGSGLGTSAALNVVWLSLINSQIANDNDRSRIAELAYELEEMLGILGGRQDQYIAAFGGICSMTFGECVEVERLSIPASMLKEMDERLTLCYTGKPRLSGNIHENVWGAFRKGATKTVNALYGLRDCAVEMRTALLSGDIDRFASLLDMNWQHQRALDPSVTNSDIERLFETAYSNGALGGKACGAGGGGCLIFCAKPGAAVSLSHALEKEGARIIEFGFEHDGLKVIRHEA